MPGTIVRPLAGLALCCVLASGCGDAPRNDPASPGGLDESTLEEWRGALGVTTTEFDSLHSRTQAALDDYWSEQYPALYGAEYRAPTVVAVEPGDEVTCDGVTRSYRDVKGRVLYCTQDATLVYDVGHLRDLHQSFGDDVVAAVLARSWGRAIQARTAPGGIPDNVLDVQADCFAGAYLSRSGATGSDELAATLAGYLLVRERSEKDRPGPTVATAFDRVTAVGDGAANGAGRCAAYADADARPALGEVEIPTAAGTATTEQAMPGIVESLNSSWGARIAGFEPIGNADAVERNSVWVCGDREEPESLPVVSYCEETARARFDESFRDAAVLIVGPGALPALVGDAWARAGAVGFGFSSDPGMDGLVVECLNGTWPGEVAAVGPQGGPIAISHETLDQWVATMLASGPARGDGLDPFERAEAFGAGFRAAVGEGPGPADACSPFL